MKRTSLLLALSSLLLMGALPKEELGEICQQYPLEGSWSLLEERNLPAPAGVVWHFHAGKFHTTSRDGQVSIKYRYKIDFSRSFPGILFSDYACCIFAVTRDSLKLCFNDDIRQMPTDFTPRQGHILYSFRRMPD